MENEVVVTVDDHCRILRTVVAGSAPVQNPLRIVICEDDEKLATLVEELLERDGRFAVVGRARDGDEAVLLVEQHTPDMVLMDIGMPGRDGIEATRAIHDRDAALSTFPGHSVTPSVPCTTWPGTTSLP